MNEPRRHESHELPKAKIVRNWRTRLFWLVPIGAAALAGWFFYSEFVRRGPTLHVLFNNAEELQSGKSELKYRGATIGTVKEISLTPDHQHVDVTISVDAAAKEVARDGSRFWVVRAQIGVGEIRAPRTIVSGNFVTVEPGQGKSQTHFIGLAEPPILEPSGDLNIVLMAEKLGSIKPRTPVFYRGIQVGEVRLCDLGPASQTVRMTVQIKRHYAPLVRLNSKFWNAGGINFNIGLRGADISAQSAETLLSGGIEFATPETTEREAYAGTTFRLYDRPQELWLTWSPRIELGPGNPPAQTSNETRP